MNSKIESKNKLAHPSVHLCFVMVANDIAELPSSGTYKPQQSCDGLKLINCTNTSVMLKNGKTHCLVISPNQIKLPSICCLAQFLILDKTKILESVEFTLLLHMKNRDPEVIWDYIENFIAYRFFRWNQEKRGRSTSALSVRWNYSQPRL